MLTKESTIQNVYSNLREVSDAAKQIQRIASDIEKAAEYDLDYFKEQNHYAYITEGVLNPLEAQMNLMRDCIVRANLLCSLIERIKD